MRARLLGVLLLVACASGTHAPTEPEPSPGASSAAAPGAATPAAVGTHEDEATKKIIAEALAHVAEVRKLAPLSPVKGAVISREALLLRMKKDVLADLEPEVQEGTTELLFSLNLTRGDFDYLANLLKLFGTQLAGFYDPQVKEMVLLDDLGVDGQEATLWHELVHALQDQHYDLQKLIKWSPDHGDRVSAAQSLAEGDATSAMMDVMLLGRGQTALDLPEDLLSKGMQVIEALPEVADVPSILKRSIVAPYADGVAFTNALRRQGGWAAVDAAWHDPPTTTEQLLHPEKYRAREPAEAVAIPPAPPGGPEAVQYHDVLGEQTLRLMLEEWVPLDTARKAAAGWAGDRVAVFATGKRRAVALALRYDDEPSARRALEVLARGALATEVQNGSPGASVSGQVPGARSPRQVVPAEDGAEASRRGQVCRERPLRGPIALVRHGRDLGVTLGPYTRDAGITLSAATCAMAISWATSVAKGR